MRFAQITLNMEEFETEPRSKRLSCEERLESTRESKRKYKRGIHSVSMSNAAWNRWKNVKAATNLRSNDEVASHLLDTWERAQMPGHVELMAGTSTADPSTPRRPLQSMPAHFRPIKELEAIVSDTRSELSGVEQISLVEKYEKKAKFAEGSFIKPRSELSEVGDPSLLGKYEMKAQSAEGSFIKEADEARSADQIKKCFENLRSYARKHLDETKHPQTGGGPKLKDPSPAITLIIERIGGNPSMTGLKKALDTEDPDMNNNLAVLCSLTGNVEPEHVPAPPRIDEEPGTSASVPVMKLSQGTLEQDEVPRQTHKPTKRKAANEVLLEEEIKRARAERRKFFWETKLIKQRLQQERELHLLQLKAMQTSSQH